MILLYILIFLSLVYLFLIMPSLEKKADFEIFKKYHYAHRGYHNNNNTDAPENSLKAFRLAVENNYGIELDIQLTKDKQIVVFHDDTLDRVCGVAGKIGDFTFDELQQFNLLNSNEKIPLFTDVLDIVDGKTPLIVEIKIYNNNTITCEFADKILSNYKGLYCIESFHPFAVKWYKEHKPNVIRGQLSCDFRSEKFNLPFKLSQYLLFNVVTRPHFIAYAHQDKNNISRRICRNLFKNFSVTWTVKSQEEYDLCKNDFDIFIFEGFKLI